MSLTDIQSAITAGVICGELHSKTAIKQIEGSDAYRLTIAFKAPVTNSRGGPTEEVQEEVAKKGPMENRLLFLCRELGIVEPDTESYHLDHDFHSFDYIVTLKSRT